MGRPSLVVPLMPIQLQPGPVDCGLGEVSSRSSSGLGEARGEAGSSSGLGEARGEARAAAAGAAGAARLALEQCLAAVRSAAAEG